MFDTNGRLLSVGPHKPNLVVDGRLDKEEVLSRALEFVREATASPAIDKKSAKRSSVDEVSRFLGTLPASAMPAATAKASTLDRYESDARIFLVVQALSRRLSLTLNSTEASIADRMTPTQPFCHITKPTLADCKAQLPEVRKLSSKRNERRDQILTQIDDPDKFFHAQIGLGAGQHSSTLEVMSVVSAVVNLVTHPIKDCLTVPRPSELELVRPMLSVPSHFSFPSGHSTYAHAQAATLNLVVKGMFTLEKSLSKLAEMIAENRVIAGLHYPSDSQAGRALGGSIACWLASIGNIGFKQVLNVEYSYSKRISITTSTNNLTACDEWAALFAAAQKEWQKAA